MGVHTAPVTRLTSWNGAASASLHAVGTASLAFCAALVILLAVLGSVGDVPRHTVAGSPESLPDWIACRHFSIVFNAVFEYLAPALATPF